MSIRVALNHRTNYRYDRQVALSPHVIRLRPAPHCRTPVLSYSLRVRPETQFVNWQQDPHGNYQAGLWLASKLTKGDLVEDDHAYSHFYAGQVFEEGKKPVLPKRFQPTCYVVVTRSKDADIDLNRKGTENEIKQKGKLVYHWPETRPLEEARVVIYAQPRDWEKNPWTVEP
jgi:transglutaminase-like putative cysteine protease